RSESMRHAHKHDAAIDGRKNLGGVPTTEHPRPEEQCADDRPHPAEDSPYSPSPLALHPASIPPHSGHTAPAASPTRSYPHFGQCPRPSRSRRSRCHLHPIGAAASSATNQSGTTSVLVSPPEGYRATLA